MATTRKSVACNTENGGRDPLKYDLALPQYPPPNIRKSPCLNEAKEEKCRKFTRGSKKLAFFEHSWWSLWGVLGLAWGPEEVSTCILQQYILTDQRSCIAGVFFQSLPNVIIDHFERAMDTIKFTKHEVAEIFEVVAACILLGEIKFTERSGFDITYIDGTKGDFNLLFHFKLLLYFQICRGITIW